jgi:Ca-activated chloride channel family protein
MNGGRLSAALDAVHRLIGRLHADDVFGLVIFDDEVRVPVPSGPVGDGAAIRDALRRIRVGGMTNLSGGLLRGIQECQRTADGTSSTLVLLSDGHANRGVTDLARLGEYAAGAAQHGITISTIGIGEDYDEDLLEAISRSGRGNAHFAANGDEAGAHLASEVDGLLEQVAQAVSLTVRPGEQVSRVRLFNDLPVAQLADGFMVELGELMADEQRRLLFEVDVPDITVLGPAEVCGIELRWVDTQTMESKVATIPVNVNVVPGDQAAGRVRDSDVETELYFQSVQKDKLMATEDMARGDIGSARSRLRRSSRRLRSADRSRMSREQVSEYEREQEWLARAMDEAENNPAIARKLMKADYNLKNRKRGRGPSGQE